MLLLPFWMQAQLKLKGKISDEEGKPVSFAQLQMEGSLQKIQSNQSGEYEVNGIKPGIHVLKIYAFTFQVLSDTINVNADTEKNFVLKSTTHRMDEVLVSSTRSASNSGIAFSEFSKDDIQKQNLGQDIPMLLNQMTSVVSTSDAGNGIGYTGLRIRGSDPTRVNITVNGIPQNDAESQGVYWVDMPDLISSVENIQVQRGAGTSTNGASAFGGTINILTQKLNPNPNVNFSVSAGSFASAKGTLTLGTGLINKHWVIDGRASYIRSDGFVDRAKSILSSYYGQAAYYGKKTFLKYILYGGNERTYQSWYGVFEGKLKNDNAMIDTLISHYFVTPSQIHNLKNSNSRTYNYYTHPNQTDNYDQKNHQLHFSHAFNNALSVLASLHYTKGKGYYEEYREQDYFSNYGLPNVLLYQADTLLVDSIETSDLLRRKWLDNDFYGGVFSIDYNNQKGLNVILGGGINQYSGDHFGRIIWAQNASASNPLKNYYFYNTLKNDYNVYLKANYTLFNRITVYGDLQFRQVTYSFKGKNDRFILLDTISYSDNFFNPKFGLNYKLGKSSELYASFAIAHKEPSGDDFSLSTGSGSPRAEHMQDFEAGWKHALKNVSYLINFYYMNYEDQLVSTGALNSVGQNIRTNVKSSYRSGIELELNANLTKLFYIQSNFTISQNKIREIKLLTDNWDTGLQHDTVYKNTSISFSPSLIASATVGVKPFKGFTLELVNKYVGRQYLDNTESISRSLDPYWVCDLRLNYVPTFKLAKEVRFTLLVNNIFNQMYSSNGWSYSYYYWSKRNHVNAYFPQAGINLMAGISVSL